MSFFVKQWYLAAASKIHSVLNPPSQERELELQEVMIFYNFVFDLGKSVNPVQAARQLLKKDFACTSANYLADTIEMAPRFKWVRNKCEQAIHAALLAAYQQRQKWQKVLLVALRHPKRSLLLLSSIRIKISTKQPSARGATKPKQTVKELREQLQSIEHIMADFQRFIALQFHADKQLFSPLYLREAPSVRLGLQPFLATIAGEEIKVEVSLLIHRTGVAILTYAVKFQQPQTADDLTQVKVLEDIGVSRFELAKALTDLPSAAASLKQYKIIPTSEYFANGIAYRTYEVQQPIKFLFLFHLYQDAILAAIHGKTLRKGEETFSWLRTPDWFAYPIRFIRQVIPKYPTDVDLKKHHAQELAGLVTGFAHWRELKPEKIPQIIANDLTITSDYSLYLEEGHTTVLYHNDYHTQLEKQFESNIPEHEWLFQFFLISGIVEALLIQRWILHVLDCELKALPYNLTKLNQLKQIFMIALDEYHNIHFSYGTAQEILKSGQEAMHIHERYEGIVQKLDRVEKLIEVKESQLLARRNLFFNFVILLLTLVAGLPSAQQIVTIISSWNIIHLNVILATQVLYLAILLLVIISIFWQLLPTYGAKRIASFDYSETAMKKHFTWSRTVRFTAAKNKTRKRQQPMP